jgi:hypothetical protein
MNNHFMTAIMRNCKRLKIVVVEMEQVQAVVAAAIFIQEDQV